MNPICQEIIAERDEARADADALANCLHRVASSYLLDGDKAALAHHDALVAKR